MFRPEYSRQAELLVRCLPEIAKQDCFALKGGTAINLFVRPVPRLSVDIDLTYLPLVERKDALSDMSHALETIASNIHRQIASVSVTIGRAAGKATRLAVAHNGVRIKIEANQILRGTVFLPETRELSAEAQALFEQTVSVQTLSFADL